MATHVPIGAMGRLTTQFNFLVDNDHLDFVPEVINLKGNVAILLAAFGVFLEHGRYLLDI